MDRLAALYPPTLSHVHINSLYVHTTRLDQRTPSGSDSRVLVALVHHPHALEDGAVLAVVVVAHDVLQAQAQLHAPRLLRPLAGLGH